MSGTQALAIALSIALSLPVPCYRRAELHYIRQRLEHPGTQAARDAHSASFRERSTAHLRLLSVRIAYTDPHIVTPAQRAFDLTGQIHYAATLEEAAQDAAKSIQALLDFITATGATVHSTTPLTEVWPPNAAEEPLPRSSADRKTDNGQNKRHPGPAPGTKP